MKLSYVLFTDYIPMKAPRSGDRDYMSVSSGADPQYGAALIWDVQASVEDRLVIITINDAKGKAEPEEYVVPFEMVRTMRRVGTATKEFVENDKPRA